MSIDMSVGPCLNLRDVSLCADDVAPGVLLRSDAPFREDLAAHNDPWPPATVIDLRHPDEQNGAHPLAGHADVVSHPLFGSGVPSAEMPKSLGEMYILMLEPPVVDRVIAAIEMIGDAATPVLVHCSAGKDRTGVLVALVLTLAGVHRAGVVADYVRTDDAIEGVIARLKSGAVDPIAGINGELPEELLRAPASAIEKVLDYLDAHPEGAAGWFLSNGGKAATITSLRERLKS